MLISAFRPGICCGPVEINGQGTKRSRTTAAGGEDAETGQEREAKGTSESERKMAHSDRRFD